MEKSNSVNMYTVDKNVCTVTVLGYVYSTAFFKRLCCIDADSVLIGANGSLFKRAAATLMQLGFIKVFHYTQADNVPNCEDLGDEFTILAFDSEETGLVELGDEFTIIAFDSEETGLVELGAIPGAHYPIFSTPVCDVVRNNAPHCKEAMLALHAIQLALQALQK